MHVLPAVDAYVPSEKMNLNPVYGPLPQFWILTIGFEIAKFDVTVL